MQKIPQKTSVSNNKGTALALQSNAIENSERDSNSMNATANSNLSNLLGLIGGGASKVSSNGQHYNLQNGFLASAAAPPQVNIVGQSKNRKISDINFSGIANEGIFNTYDQRSNQNNKKLGQRTLNSISKTQGVDKNQKLSAQSSKPNNFYNATFSLYKNQINGVDQSITQNWNNKNIQDLAFSTKSSAFNSKQGTQVIPKKLLSNANQMISDNLNKNQMNISNNFENLSNMNNHADIIPYSSTSIDQKIKFKKGGQNQSTAQSNKHIQNFVQRNSQSKFQSEIEATNKQLLLSQAKNQTKLCQDKIFNQAIINTSDIYGNEYLTQNSSKQQSQTRKKSQIGKTSSNSQIRQAILEHQLNQSQVVQVKSPLIKERMDNAQNQQDYGIDDDYQFGSNFKRGNTALNSDETKKNGNNKDDNFDMNSTDQVINEVFASRDQSNFYMTQVIKQQKAGNDEFQKNVEIQDAYNPLNMTQSSIKSNQKGIIQKISGGKNKNGGQSNSTLKMKISKSQLKSRQDNKKQSFNQSSNNNIGNSQSNKAGSLKSALNNQLQEISPLNSRLKRDHMILEKYLAQNNTNELTLQSYGLQNYQTYQNSSGQNTYKHKKRGALNSSALIINNQTLGHRSLNQTQQNLQMNDYLNSTAPLNLTQINQLQNDDNSYIAGSKAVGLISGLSDAINSTQNLKRINSKDSWKDIINFSTQKQQHLNQNNQMNMSSLYYSGALANKTQTRGIENNNQIATRKVKRNIQNSLSPLQEQRKKQLLIKNILKQDGLSQQKNKKFFLNLTLQQLIQQQKGSNLNNQTQIPGQNGQDSQIQKTQTSLNKTLDHYRNDNQTNQNQINPIQDEQLLSRFQEHSDLRKFINNFVQGAVLSNQNDVYAQDNHNSRQQTKSFNSSMNKLSNTMKFTDFNNTQQIFADYQKASFNVTKKSKSSLKSTQNLNLKDELNNITYSLIHNNQGVLPNKQSALSTYSLNTAALPTSTNGGAINRKQSSGTISQVKSRKVVKPGAVQVNASQSRLSINNQQQKHKKKSSQDQDLIQINLTNGKSNYANLKEECIDEIISSGNFDQNIVKSKQQLAFSQNANSNSKQSAFNAYQTQSKYKTNSSLNQYLGSSNTKTKLNNQKFSDQSQSKQKLKSRVSNSFINFISDSNNKQVIQSNFNQTADINNSYENTFTEVLRQKQVSKNISNSNQTRDSQISSALKRFQNSVSNYQQQRQIQKQLAQSALIQDLTQFGIQQDQLNKQLTVNKKQKINQINNFSIPIIINQEKELNTVQKLNNITNNPYSLEQQQKLQSNQNQNFNKRSVGQLKKEQIKEIQNKTQPIPKHLLEMVAQAEGGSGGINFSTGTSIIINRQPSRESNKSKSCKSRQQNQSAISKNKKQSQNITKGVDQGKKDVQRKQNKETQQKQDQNHYKHDNPSQIYNNKHTIILEEINSRDKDSLEKNSADPSIINLKTDDEQYQDSNSKLDRFVLGKQVGQGAYAVVRVAQLKRDGKKYAIKIYDKSKLTDTNRQRSVRREIKLLQKMNHANIVKIYEAFETDEHVYLVMEYVAGDNLYSYLKQHKYSRLEEKEAKRIFKQLLTALQYCHRKSIAHRDIKLENILLDEDRNVKLIDFGFSTCIPNDKKIKMFCGTPSYMAPEIVNKDEYAGPPADIWASGVLLYALMNGKFPFRGDTDRDLYRRINRGTFEIHNPLISQHLINFLTRMINTNADDRPSAEDLLQDEWFKIEADQVGIEEKERLHQEFVKEQKKLFKAKILAKVPIEKTKNTICLVSNDKQGQVQNKQSHNINLGAVSSSNQINSNLRQNLANQNNQGFNQIPNNINNNLNLENLSDYGNLQSNNLKRLNQEAYQAYYNTSGGPNWHSNNTNVQNPYYNNFFVQPNGSSGFSNNQTNPSSLNGFYMNYANQQTRSSPSKTYGGQQLPNTSGGVNINTNPQFFPINFTQQPPNQIGTPQVFASPTGFACTANMINNNFNIINNITQVTCLPQVAQSQSMGKAENKVNNKNNTDTKQNGSDESEEIYPGDKGNINQIQRYQEQYYQVGQEDFNDENGELDPDIIESIIQMGYHRSHVVSQIADCETSQIATLYHKLKEEKMSLTQNRPLSLQPHRRRGNHGLEINSYLQQNFVDQNKHNNVVYPPNFIPSITDSLKATTVVPINMAKYSDINNNSSSGSQSQDQTQININKQNGVNNKNANENNFYYSNMINKNTNKPNNNYNNESNYCSGVYNNYNDQQLTKSLSGSPQIVSVNSVEF